MAKRDLYIDYNKHKKRRGNRSPKTFRNIVIIIILATVLGLGAYYLAKEGFISLDFLSIAKEDPEVIEQAAQESTQENIKDENLSSPKNEGESLEPETEEIKETEDSLQETVNYQNNDKVPVKKEGTKVKGIYVTGPVAGNANRMGKLVDLVNTTELNAMVIDIKNDTGEITYNMEHDLVSEMGANTNYVANMEQLVKDLKEQDIYLIARVVAFKDPLLAKKKPELCIKNTDGSPFRDKDGLGWVNPYNKDVWEYIIQVSKEAVDIGFDEIQFDYIRFSTDPKMKNVDFGIEAEGKSKTDIIIEFTEYAYEELSSYGAFVSADVYGAIIDSEIDQAIVGQDYVEMSKHLDYICPMIYPSHYADGSFEIEYPDLEPYKLILASLNESKEVLSEIEEGEHVAIVRPWLQDFTAPWISKYQKYGPEQIREQVEGVYDSGYEEWILWNGSNKYTEEGLLKE